MTTAGAIVDTIAERVRDPANTAHSREDIRDVFNRVQTALNSSEGYVLETLPFDTIPGQSIYRLEQHTPNLSRITDIECDGRYLDQIPWRNLWKASNTWLTDVGDPLVWAMIGRSLFAVYPVPVQPKRISIQGPKITRILVDDNTPIDLRDEDADIAIDLATAIFLMRGRDWQAARNIAARAADRLGLQEDAIMEERRIDDT